MAVWSWNAFIAIICGNVVIWKPSSKTPLCAIAIHKICQQILEKNQLPDIISLVLPESRELSENIIKDIRIPLISFTGSTDSGQKVAKIVAERLGRCLLELGGNNAVIIDETANLKLATPAIVFGAVGTAGQRCTSTRRVFIHETKFKEVKTKLVHAYQQIKIGDPMRANFHMGPLIDKFAVDIYLNAIKEIVAAGGRVIFGGKCIEQKGYFVEPTLVEGLSNSNPLIQKETFAPILYLIPFESFDDAIKLQNTVPQGLSSALFSESLTNVEYFLSVLGSDCGIANINIGTSGAEITGAFGGEKATGGGREAGSDAWKAYMRRQTNTINWGDTLPLAQGIKFELN
jgi:aldehyde dehydrogenase (NAD+)